MVQSDATGGIMILTFENLDKCCIHCGDRLTKLNFKLGNLKEKNYKCSSCDSFIGKRNRLKRLARNEDIRSKHYYEEEVKEGFVYLIHNKILNAARGPCFKIGMAVSDEERLKGYQTSFPDRDAELFYSVYTKDKRALEDLFKSTLLLKGFNLSSPEHPKSEWFNGDIDIAKDILINLSKLSAKHHITIANNKKVVVFKAKKEQAQPVIQDLFDYEKTGT